MSVLIKGIKMPKCCVDCPCFYDFISCQALPVGACDFSISEFDEYKERLPNCPLVEIDEAKIDTQEERYGKWIDYRRIGIDGTFHWFRQCSECLYEREDDNEDKDTPYCPNCGAKMDLKRSDRMTTNDGYTIIQYPTKNAIVITLPQRWDSLTNTFVPVSDRRKCLSDTEEAALLATVKAMFENGARMDGEEE